MKGNARIFLLFSSIFLVACGSSKVIINKKSNNHDPVTNGLTQDYQVPQKLVSKVIETKQKIFWEKDPHTSLDYMTWKINGEKKSYRVRDIVDYSKFPQGFNFATVTYDYKDNRITSEQNIYHMPYSLFFSVDTTEEFNKLQNKKIPIDKHSRFSVYALGLRTEVLPTSGTAVYTGAAFDKESRGSMQLLVDFAKKSIISGTLSGLKQGDIHFQRGEIKPIVLEDVYDHPYVASIGFSGNAIGVKLANPNAIAYYKGQFFGPNAEEVNGLVESLEIGENGTLKVHAGFGGQRGNIKQ